VRVKEVKIVSWPEKLSVDQSSEFVCLSTGSKPAPILKWFIDNNQLSSSKETIIESEMTTKSLLNLRPLAFYNNKKLTCDAVNFHFSDDHLRDFITLNISCEFHIFRPFNHSNILNLISLKQFRPWFI
jgi:CD80-like C2-set immunoglobulin domain